MSIDASSALHNPNDVPLEEIIDDLCALVGFLALQLHTLRDHPNLQETDICGGYVAEVDIEALQTFDDAFEQTVAVQEDKVIITGTLRELESKGNA